MVGLQGTRAAEKHDAPASRLRIDIQLLWAWAVIAVVMKHAGVPFLPGGFLGVDIFFVVSGFLMTRQIDEALAAGTFTFAGFYARRARRLLPAAYATFAVVAIAAPFLLDATEYGSFVAQLAGAFTFLTNLVLWKQVDYFGTAGAPGDADARDRRKAQQLRTVGRLRQSRQLRPVRRMLNR